MVDFIRRFVLIPMRTLPRFTFMTDWRNPLGRVPRGTNFKYKTHKFVEVLKHPLFSLSLKELSLPVKELYIDSVPIADSAHVAYFTNPRSTQRVENYLQATRINGVTAENAEHRLARNQELRRLIVDGVMEPRIQVVADTDQNSWRIVDGAHRASALVATNAEAQLSCRVPILWLVRNRSGTPRNI